MGRKDKPKTSAGAPPDDGGGSRTGHAQSPAQHRRAEGPLWRRIKEYDANKVIAVGTLVVAFTGVLGVWLTLNSLKQSQQNFSRGLRETRSDFEATERPVLGLGRKDGVVAEFAVPNAASLDRYVGLRIYVENSGPSAALTPNLQVYRPPLVIFAKGQKPMRPLAPAAGTQPPTHLLRVRNKGGALETVGGGAPIAPGSERMYSFPDLLTKQEYESMVAGGRTMLLNGFCEYCDEFGNYRCQQFTLYYQGAPFNAFSVIDSVDCSSMYAYPRKRVPGAHYLLPCEQPAEREADQARERALLLKEAESPSPTPDAQHPRDQP